MPIFNIHLAVGKRYREKNDNVQDENEFYKGLIAPDFTDDKNKSHYTKIDDDAETLREHFENKVQLYDYLKTEPDNTDFEKGIFLHLITDYLFFTTFFDREYLLQRLLR